MGHQYEICNLIQILQYATVHKHARHNPPRCFIWVENQVLMYTCVDRVHIYMQLFTTTHTTCTTVYRNISLLHSCHLDQRKVPQLTLNEVRHTTVEYQTQRNDNITIPLVAGYEVTRFGVPMIGQYVNTVRGSRVTIIPAVPGAQYRITAWALGDGGRSATPAVVDVTTGEASKCPKACKLHSVYTYKSMLRMYCSK